MPKRQPKPELISPDEVMDSPALKGFDAFLRFRPAEDLSAKPGPVPVEQPAEISGDPQVETALPPVSIPSEPPIGDSPIGQLPIGNTIVPVIRPPQKVRRAVKVQDGHSTGEQALYQALWNAGVVETPDTKLLRIGYGGMQHLCGLDRSNCKDNTLALIKKLSIEVAAGFNIRRNEGNTYRIFSYTAILKRRRAAGLEWVIRNRGVHFVGKPPIGDLPLGDTQTPIGEMPIAPMGETPIGPMGETPIASRKGIESGSGRPSPSSVLVEALLRYCTTVDDDGIHVLVDKCRQLAPDCTTEEIAHFIHAKAQQALSSRNIRNLMGFLQTAVPRCFKGQSFLDFRVQQAKEREAEERRQKEAEAQRAELEAEQHAILANPNASEEDKHFARMILGIDPQADQ